jgi:formate hydrogenlyase transcriptional activator
VRLIAATNQNLEEMVKARQFRSDLYYRLKVFPITIPPLRERPEDVPLPSQYFMRKHAKRMRKGIEIIPPEAMEALKRWHWPGNVRELENFIERAVILSRGRVPHVPTAEIKTARSTAPLPAATITLENAEREAIIRALRRTGGVIGGPNGAAAQLGLKRTTLNFKMRKLGITRKPL